MKNLRFLPLILLIVIFVSCKKEEVIVQKWYKGNLHTHSYWSDGDEFPEIIMDWYKSHDYHFVALTDHNTLAEGEKWKVISPDSIYQMAFQNYLEKYGENWVDHRLDSLDQTEVKLKNYEEYRGEFEEEEQFLILQAEEISDHFEGKPLHLNATNVIKKIDPQGGNSVLEVLQNNIDAVVEQKNEMNIPMLVHINHPNFHYAITLEDMIALRNEQFFELYNGHNAVNNEGDSTHISTEKMWDLINIAYIENDLPMMYGLATDDAHHYHEKGKSWSNAGRGWIEVRADSLNPSSLFEAMEAGDFYASTGVKLDDVTFDNKVLTVDVSQEEGVAYEISFVWYTKGSVDVEELSVSKEAHASFEVTDDMLFVRARITSSKLHENPVEDMQYETAWTQPVRRVEVN